MKAALIPTPSTAVRDISAQRPGYAVEVPSASGYLFACDPSHVDEVEKYGGCIWSGGALGFCMPSGPVKVWDSRYAADVAARQTGGKVVTVPRVVGEVAGGPVLTWSEVPA